MTRTAKFDPKNRREKMRAIFEPMLQSSKKESFFNEWDKWFVLTDTIDDLRKPGLLKRMFIF